MKNLFSLLLIAVAMFALTPTVSAQIDLKSDVGLLTDTVADAAVTYMTVDSNALKRIGTRGNYSLEVAAEKIDGTVDGIIIAQRLIKNAWTDVDTVISLSDAAGVQSAVLDITDKRCLMLRVRTVSTGSQNFTLKAAVTTF